MAADEEKYEFGDEVLIDTPGEYEDGKMAKYVKPAMFGKHVLRIPTGEMWIYRSDEFRKLS